MKKEDLIYFQELPIESDGPTKLPIKLLTDFKDYDPSFEELPKLPQTNLFELLQIDLVEHVYQLITEGHKTKTETLPFLRKSEYIASDYYDKQARRSEVLKNLRLALAKKEEDYTNYHVRSFRDIKEEISCVEKFNLHKSEKKMNLFYFENDEMVGDIIIKDKKVIINNKLHDANEVDMDDYMIISIEDGKAYYMDVDRCLKIKK